MSIDYKNKLQLILFSLKNEDIKEFIRKYNDKVKNNANIIVKQSECKTKKEANEIRRDYIRDNKITQYSSYTKYQLISFLINFFDENEIKNAYNSFRAILINQLLESCSLILNKKYKREWIDSIQYDEEDLLFEIIFNGFSWKVNTNIFIGDNKLLDYDCDCKIGQKNGLCIHVFVGFVIAVLNKIYNLKVFPLFLSEDDIKNINDMKLLAIRILKTKI